MSKAFQFILDNEDGSDLLIFSGNINENSRFPESETLNQKSLILNLDKIEMINSLGIRSWTRWMKELNAGVITLRNCTPALVQQMNIVSGFLPEKAVIESFYVPFYCDHCDTESVVLLERNKDFLPKTSESELKLNFDKTMNCENCGEQKQIDVLEGKYFSFLKKGSF